MTIQLKEIQEFYRNEKYDNAAQWCEKLIEDSLQPQLYYWHLGLIYLLKGNEEEAHVAWMAGMMDGDEAETVQWTNELCTILDIEADYQLSKDNIESAVLLRQHAYDINPFEIDNVLKILQLAIKDQQFSPELLKDLDITNLLGSSDLSSSSQIVVLKTLELILQNLKLKDEIIDFVRAAIQATNSSEDIYLLLIKSAHELVKADYHFESAITIGELYLSVNPNDLEFMGYISGWYNNIQNFDKAIEFAHRRLSASDEWVEKIFSSYLVLKATMGAGGYWKKAEAEFSVHESLILELDGMDEDEVTVVQLLRLICTTFFLPYLRDKPVLNRKIHNLVAESFEKGFSIHRPIEICHDASSLSLRNSRIKETGKIRVGYISHCFSQHSVGWITRWLMKYHDRERFELYGYVINCREGDSLHTWYLTQFHHVCKVGIDCLETGGELAKKIYQDQIDILVDLDSITLDLTCEVMAYKPAPIQATWLGWDASGIPSIDYFIADQFVLPEEADKYYSEKIYRLPQTYVAVDGFEVEVQTLKREDLDIPSDAIVYMTSQGGYKRHPDTIKLQLLIIKNVPNSYLVIKGPSDQKTIETYFRTLAIEVGVSEDKLRFLPQAPSEAIHRANLRIADVVLDTYPYNGATTTLETLWMEIPLVTLVGQQFSARNSYTMLKNVGVEAGISWSPEEYVEWGTRFGTDVILRQQVSWQLRQSKSNAPLWNSRKFAEEMANAYLNMWNMHQVSYNDCPAKIDNILTKP
jgi:predicted O-linked N-acetylglucosamine transferase (SPINDLY family)